MEKNVKNGQNCVAASAQENENINYADTMYDAFLKSMTWFVGGKGVVMTVKNTNINVWVEKTTSKNRLSYKFVVECNGKRRSVEVDSRNWSDYSLFSGEMIKVISNHLSEVVNYMIKEG